MTALVRTGAAGRTFATPDKGCRRLTPVCGHSLQLADNLCGRLRTLLNQGFFASVSGSVTVTTPLVRCRLT